MLAGGALSRLLIHAVPLAFALGLAGLATGCATTARQTQAYLEAPRTVPEAKQVENVPFVEQSENHCGPATLAMAMGWAGKPVAMEALAGQTFTPGQKGAFQADMLSASRRNGMMAVEVRGIPALMKELSEGHPVIVLQNLAFSWYPKWHYAVAHGYDLSKPELLLHSGPDAGKRVDLRKFERSWELADYWGIVVLPPGQLSASADELAHAGAAAALESLGKAKEAELAYTSILSRWPESLGALIGMGNLRYAVGDFQGSARFLARATKAHPLSSVAWHNLTVAQGAARQLALARKSAIQAVGLAEDPAIADRYRASLAEWLAPHQAPKRSFESL